jgi:hypothetical protein
VVIPVWDEYVGFLGEAIRSVIEHLGKMIKLLVIDNASSAPIPLLPPSTSIARLATRRSAGAARNVGLRMADTEFVLFLDADDVLAPGTIPLLRSTLLGHPDASAAVCGIVAWNPRSNARIPLAFPSRMTRGIVRRQKLYQLYSFLSNRMPTTGCMLMRTRFALDAGGFTDSDFAEDWALNVGLGFHGRIAYVPFHGRLLRAHSGSLRSQPRARADVRRAFELMIERLRSDPSTPQLVRRALPLLRTLYARRARQLTPDGVTLRAARISSGSPERSGVHTGGSTSPTGSHALTCSRSSSPPHTPRSPGRGGHPPARDSRGVVPGTGFRERGGHRGPLRRRRRRGREASSLNGEGRTPSMTVSFV